MGTRRARLLVLGVGCALAPFLVVVFFTWARDGHPIGMVPLLGRGDLLPPTALLTGGVLVDGHLARRGGAIWHIAVGFAWLSFVLCSVGYVIPYASPTAGAPRRLTVASLACLVTSVVSGLALIGEEPRER